MRTKSVFQDNCPEFHAKWLFQSPPRKGSKLAQKLVRDDLGEVFHVDEQIVDIMERRSLAERTK